MTLEVWARPGVPMSGRLEKYIIGSDIPTRGGIGLGLLYRGPLAHPDWSGLPLLMSQTLPVPGIPAVNGQFVQTVTPGEWSHLATLKNGNAATPLLVKHLLYQLHGLKNIKAAEFNVRVGSILREMRAIDDLFDPKVSVSQYVLSQRINRYLDRATEGRLDHLGARKNAVILLVFQDMRALARVAGDEPRAIRVLADIFNGPFPLFRLEALRMLTDMSVAHPSARKKLLSCVRLGLRQKDVDMRLAGVDALAQLGAGAKPLIPTLKRVKITDPSEEVRQAAGRVLTAVEGS